MTSAPFPAALTRHCSFGPSIPTGRVGNRSSPHPVCSPQQSCESLAVLGDGWRRQGKVSPETILVCAPCPCIQWDFVLPRARTNTGIPPPQAPPLPNSRQRELALSTRSAGKGGRFEPFIITLGGGINLELSQKVTELSCL